MISGPLSASEIRSMVTADIDRLLEPWMTGRSPAYVMGHDLRLTVATAYWLDRELALICNDKDRKTQCWKFSRMSRSYDTFESAAEIVKEALDGTVEQDRKPHRRWG